MQEPSSKAQFSAHLALPSDKDAKLRVFATGIRTKLMFQVYAFGLYLDEVKALDQFNAKFGSGRPEQLAKENRFFDSIITSTQVKKALKLKFLRNITGDDMKEAFNVSIGERLKKFAKGEAEMKEGSKALESFKSQFTGQKLAKGSTITFYFDEAGGLTTHIDDSKVGAVTSSIISRCLLDVYLGETPIDKNAKLQLAKTMQQRASQKLKAKL